jgi:hypothetical protein
MHKKARQKQEIGRSRKEEDIEDLETKVKHKQREVNHVNRGIKSDCQACKGSKQGQHRPSRERKVK